MPIHVSPIGQRRNSHPRASLREHEQRFAPLEIAVGQRECFMQREGFFVRAFVKVALPMRAQSVGAFVAEKNSAAQWALGVGVAVTEMEIGTIATRLRHIQVCSMWVSSIRTRLQQM